MRYLLLLVGCVAVIGCESPVGPEPVATEAVRRHEGLRPESVPHDCAPIVTYPESPWYGGCRTPDGYVYDRHGRLVWWPTGR